MTATAAVDVRGLVKRFGRFAAVDGLDLTVAPASVHGFLGPNGAGKTTTIRTLLGLYRAGAGTVRVLGRDPARAAAAITRRTSYVPGDVSLWPNLTGQQCLDALAGLRGARDEAAERRLATDFAIDLRKTVRAYSKGNRQKVLLIAAFAAPSELLVLDEPTSGLDPLMEEVFRRQVRAAAAAGRTVLLSSHILSEVEQLCDAVTIVKDGRLVESGPLAQLRHLAASRITASVGAADLIGLRAELDGFGVVDAGGLTLSVPRPQVPSVLAVLARSGAADITCTPASLEDLFLRHYEVAAR
ncbi:ABC transporter ATP-binding protein [Dactylosporangium sp. NPDC051541]|uniref:ABC transporter ATP-binding protein n=1 Tax=Dactylosporangium sp. NPDC051541 TaxID=3363977 RepID=UPI0037AF7DCA